MTLSNFGHHGTNRACTFSPANSLVAIVSKVWVLSCEIVCTPFRRETSIHTQVNESRWFPSTYLFSAFSLSLPVRLGDRDAIYNSRSYEFYPVVTTGRNMHPASKMYRKTSLYVSSRLWQRGGKVVKFKTWRRPWILLDCIQDRKWAPGRMWISWWHVGGGAS